MVDAASMTDAQIREAGLSILLKELGPVGFLRFLKHYELGYGNYTEERQELLKGETVNSIADRIKKRENLNN